MEPNFILARVTLGLNQEQLGLTKEAIAEFRKFGETDPTDVATTAALGHALVKNGRTAEARIILSDPARTRERSLCTALQDRGFVRRPSARALKLSTGLSEVCRIVR